MPVPACLHVWLCAVLASAGCFSSCTNAFIDASPRLCNWLTRLQGPEKRAEIGIKDSLVRYSCGVESVEDLWDDLEQALQQI